MKNWDTGREAGRLQEDENAKPRLERQRHELPRGGREIGSQIGAELRSVFAPVPMTKLSGSEDLIARIDLWNDDIG